MDDDGQKRGGIFLVPHKARLYLLLAAFFLTLPTLSELYPGAGGKFLVARGPLNGSFFEKTVLYVEEHTLFEAYGFVINRPVKNAQPRKEFKELYSGGPVNEEIVSILVDNHDALSGFSIQALPADAKLPAGKIHKAYLGYAGWYPWQLNIEIIGGAWYVLDYDSDLMFNTAPEDMWEKAIEKLGVESLKENFGAL